MTTTEKDKFMFDAGFNKGPSGDYSWENDFSVRLSEEDEDLLDIMETIILAAIQCGNKQKIRQIKDALEL